MQNLSRFVYLLSIFLTFSLFSISQSNPCNIKATFTNSRDTIVTADTFRGHYFNTTVGATSFKWLINGLPYYYSNKEPILFDPFFNNSTGVGIYKLQLAVSNGICQDTATTILVFTGNNPPSQKKYFSSALSVADKNFPGLTSNIPNDIIATSDQQYLVSGQYQLNIGVYPPQIKAILFNINDTGCIKWSKVLPNEYLSFISTASTSNGDNLSIVSMSGSRITLIRTDPNGNVIWSKTPSQNSPLADYIGYSKIAEDPYGNIIITGSVFNNNVNEPSSGIIVSKLDKNGNIIWNKVFWKKYQQPNVNYTIPYDILTIGSDIFISGYSGVVGSSRKEGLLVKLNNLDGKVVWSKTYSQSSSTNFYLKDLHLIGNMILLNADKNVISGSSSIIPMYMYADTSGNIQEAYQININDFPITFPYKTRIIPIPNNGFYFTTYATESLSLQPGYQYHSMIAKINNQNNIQWQNTFSTSYRDYYNGSALGAKNGLISIGAGVISEYASLFQNPILFTKFDSSGNINSLCNFDKTNYSTQISNCSSFRFNWDYDSSFQYSFTNISLQLKDITIYKKWLCPSYIDSCTYLEIDGPQKICDLSATYNYRIHSVGSCGYQFIHSANVKLISQSDTMVSVSFLTPGVHTLKIVRNSNCNSISDSLQVISAPFIYYFSLGNDTTLCSGGKLILNAGNKFLNYSWQDGSTDSLFTVKNPGKYYVTVKDSCNNIKSDTIIVQQTPVKYLHFLKDQNICSSDSILLQAAKGYRSYNWSPTNNLKKIDSTLISIKPSFTTTYRVNALDSNNCSILDTALIRVLILPKPDLGNDTTLCEGNSILLNPGPAFLSYIWNTGAITPSITVNTSNLFKVTVTDNNGCKNKDSITVSFQSPPVFSLGKDTSLCGNQTLLLKTDSSGVYLWQDGSMGSVKTVNSPGFYWLQISRGSCVYRDSIKIAYNSFPVIQIPKDSILCDQATLLLDATQIGTNATYKWQDGSTKPTYFVSQPGNYIVKVTNQNCITIDTSSIQFQKSPKPTIIRDTTKCTEDTIHLDLTLYGASYLWQDFSQKPTYSIINQGTYYCTIKNSCGIVTDSITVRNIICQCQLYIPNAFSPNGDGINDEFKPSVTCLPAYFDLVIFNRMGQIVFKSSDINNTWKGTYNGKPIPIGTYYYIIKIKGAYDTFMRQHSGSITLLR